MTPSTELAHGRGARGAAGGGYRGLRLSAADQGRPFRGRVRRSQPLATRVDARRDCPGSGSRRSDLGDARAPQGGSRTARERRAAGVSSPAERRGPPVERCRRPSRKLRQGIFASTSAQPASAMRNSGAASTSFAASTPAAPSRSSERPCESPCGARWARLSGAARPSWSATCRRIERLSDDDRAAFRSRQIAAFVGVARFKDGQMVAAFGVNHDTPRVWTAGEIELVREVAERTWDAVERTRAEAALREQKTRLRLALEASAGGSWTWDPRTNDADWDDAFRAQFGFTPEEPPLFETWLARVHVEDRPRMRRILEEILQTKDTWDHTYRVLRPDGSRALDAESGTSRSRRDWPASRGSLDSSWTSPSAAGLRMLSRRVATRNTIARCERCSRPPRRASCRRTRVGCSSLRIVRSR